MCQRDGAWIHVRRIMLVLAALAASTRAFAQPAVGTSVVRAAPDARLPVAQHAGFATSIDLDTRGRLAASTGDLLDEAPGLHVRRTGDGFAPQSIVLRGAPGAHVPLALDGVVLNDAASDGVDVALIPPAMLQRADVYRGAAPVRLGVSGLGGAVEFVTRRAEPGTHLWSGAAYGSFAQRRVTSFVSTRGARGEMIAALQWRASDGDFRYYDDRGTPRLPGIESVRRNAASAAIDALVRACMPTAVASRGACLMALASWRDRQVPGPGAHPSDGPYATQHRVLVRAGIPWRAGAWQGEAWSAVVTRDDLFVNAGPVTLFNTTPYVARSTTTTMELGATAHVDVPWMHFEPALRVRRERFNGGLLSLGALDAARLSGLVGYEARHGVSRLTLEHGAALEALHDQSDMATGTRVVTTLRGGARLTLAPWMEVRASGGRFERAPTLPELYGDRGFVRGNSTLRPERAWHVDAGITLATTGARHTLHARLEAAAFVREVVDLIALVQVNRSRFQGYNLGAVSARGVEVQGRLVWRDRLRTLVAWAYTDARVGDAVPSLAGNRVPGVPAHDLYASVEAELPAGELGDVTLGANLSFVTGTFLDETNDPAASVPTRAMLDASIAFAPRWPSDTTYGLVVTNLLDQRTATRTLPDGVVVPVAVQDYFGYPLPGRAVLATVTIAVRPRRSR